MFERALHTPLYLTFFFGVLIYSDKGSLHLNLMIKFHIRRRDTGTNTLRSRKGVRYRISSYKHDPLLSAAPQNEVLIRNLTII